MTQLNPQLIIDELTKRLQQLTLENVVLSARLTEAEQEKETTVIGEHITEE